MTMRRRLLLTAFGLGCLACIYIVCVTLERHPSYGPQGRFYGLNWSSSGVLHTTEGTVVDKSSNSTQTLTSRSKLPSAVETKVEDEKEVSALRPKQPPESTEPSYIGDRYTTEDISPLTDCPQSIRKHVGETEFGERFLERIPVLQWDKHATPQEYQRLSRYSGTHGWAGVDIDTLFETLSVLKTAANRQMLDDWTSRSNGSSCSRCAVVGNGGILKGSRKGKEIDGHDYVFRTNGAIIKGFEEDVGSRTTHYTFSTNTLMNSMRSYVYAGYRGPPMSKETRYVFLPDHDRDYLLMKAAATHTPVQKGRDVGANPMKYFGNDVSVEKLKMYHPDFIRYLRNRFLRSGTLNTKYRNIYRPSTGATMLLAALHSCDQVSAYGFMTPDFKSYSDHYYDTTYHPVGFFINHDLHMEMLLWQQLHHAGLFRLYMRQDAALR